MDVLRSEAELRQIRSLVRARGSEAITAAHRVTMLLKFVGFSFRCRICMLNTECRFANSFCEKEQKRKRGSRKLILMIL